MIASQLYKILILLLIVPGGPIAASEWPAASDFDSYMAQTMKDFKVPGAAVAIVRDGMTGTLFSSAEARKNSDCAQPYRKNRRTGKVQHIAFGQFGDVGAAGGINSNLNDMVRYDSSVLLFTQCRISRRAIVSR